jgi:hypothetical protein
MRKSKKWQMANSLLKTGRGEVVAIGRVKIPKTSWFNHEIPLLSFVVIKKDDSYISACIHLRIDGYGKTVEEAEVDMADNIWSFLEMNFSSDNCKDICWLNIYDLFKGSKSSTILWDKYHAVQLILAERGESTDSKSHYMSLQKKIDLLEGKVSELEEKIMRMNSEQMKSLISESMRKDEMREKIKGANAEQERDLMSKCLKGFFFKKDIISDTVVDTTVSPLLNIPMRAAGGVFV